MMEFFIFLFAWMTARLDGAASKYQVPFLNDPNDNITFGLSHLENLMLPDKNLEDGVSGLFSSGYRHCEGA
jgi:hypothetical protein